jgi:hypothetical protein
VGQIGRKQGHLVVAAVRVLSHQLERSPRPEEMADLLHLPAALLRVHLAELQELGIVALVESAFDTHVEVLDHLRLEELPPDRDAADLEADLADFDRRKLEEAERMDRLFSEGERERRQQQKLRKMEEELRGFHQRKKPRSPFDDDQEPES